MGRRRNVDVKSLEQLGSAREVERKAEGYLERCRAEGRRATRPGLRAELGLTEDLLCQLERGEVKGKEEVSAALRRAMEWIRDEMEQGKDSVSVFLLKQPCYGGYADKPVPEEKGGGGLRVSFSGEGKEYGV